MIPQVIHYCWFGGNPLPEKAQKCIASWKKYFPEHEVKCWDESSFDVHICAYTHEAYEARKWAFVSDYARFWILYQQGGIYFDTDVEVIRDFSPILEAGAFMGCEVPNEAEEQVFVAPGLGLGAPAGLPVYKEILEYYQNQHFLQEDGSNCMETVVAKTTRIMQSRGFDPSIAGMQMVDDICIYPPEYFCPMDYATGKLTITERTYSIHHYDATWLEDYQKKERAIIYALSGVIGRTAAAYVGRVYTLPFRVIKKYKQMGLIGVLRFAFSKLCGSTCKK